MWNYLTIISIGVVFYLLIPGLGAFHVRGRWRTFRKRISDSVFYPQVRYRRLTGQDEGYLGMHRFFGNLEAIQGDDTIWLRGGNTAVSAELSGVGIYLLPGFSSAENEGVVERNEEGLPDEMPQLLPWSRVFSLPEGTQVFISGPLYADHGHRTFRPTENRPLTVVFYDGEPDTILRRSIWGARQRNEYWNRFTPASLIAGTLALLLLAYNYLQTGSRVPGIVTLAFCTTPIIPFLPPGLPLFFIYRLFWKKARFNRAERDILRLPMRYFAEDVGPEGSRAVLPDGGIYAVEVYADHALALDSMTRQKVRTASLLRPGDRQYGLYHVFGVLEEPGKKGMKDPMAEHVLIPGDPLALAHRGAKRATLLEVLAAFAFVACYVLNLFGILILFNLWII